MNDHLKKSKVDSCGNIAHNSEGNKFKNTLIEHNKVLPTIKININKTILHKLKVLTTHIDKLNYIVTLAVEYSKLEESQLKELQYRNRYISALIKDITKLKSIS